MNRFSQLFFDFAHGRKNAPSARPATEAPPATDSEPPVSAATDCSIAAAPPSPSPTAIPGIDPALTALARQLSNALGLRDLPERVSVHWNARLKTTAGTANPRTAMIDLNCSLKTFGEDVVMRILKHELAHLVAHDRAGRRRIEAHGAEWRQACTDLGIPGEKSRHTLPFKSTPQRRKYAYQCPECGDVALRVRKFSRFSACWTCCKKHNRGQYAERFQFVQIPLERGATLAAALDCDSTT